MNKKIAIIISLVGSLIFLIGAVFIFKLAIDSSVKEENATKLRESNNQNKKPANTSVNKSGFSVKNYGIVIDLSPDKDRGAVANVTETIIADFPANKLYGMNRNVIKQFNKQSVKIDKINVTDENNSPIKYSIVDNTTNYKTIAIGEPTTFVNGVNTYKIKYRLSHLIPTNRKNIIRSANNKNTTYQQLFNLELLNQFAAPIDNFVATINLKDGLDKKLGSHPSCSTDDQKRECHFDKNENGEYRMELNDSKNTKKIFVNLAFKDAAFK